MNELKQAHLQITCDARRDLTELQIVLHLIPGFRDIKRKKIKLVQNNRAAPYLSGIIYKGRWLASVIILIYASNRFSSDLTNTHQKHESAECTSAMIFPMCALMMMMMRDALVSNYIILNRSIFSQRKPCINNLILSGIVFLFVWQHLKCCKCIPDFWGLLSSYFVCNCDLISCYTWHVPGNSRAQCKDLVTLLRSCRCAACCLQLLIKPLTKDAPSRPITAVFLVRCRQMLTKWPLSFFWGRSELTDKHIFCDDFVRKFNLSFFNGKLKEHLSIVKL